MVSSYITLFYKPQYKNQIDMMELIRLILIYLKIIYVYLTVYIMRKELLFLTWFLTLEILGKNCLDL